MIRLEHTGDGHSKFWEASVAGATLTVRFGRIGTDGQVKAKDLADAAAARGELDRLIAEKLGKGYVRAGAGAAPKKAKKATAKAKEAASGAAKKRPALEAPFEALIRILAADPRDADAIVGEVHEALADRKAYLAGRGAELADDRNIDAGDDVAWVVMVDRLGRRGWLGEADHDEGGDDLRFHVDQALAKRIAKSKKRWAWVDEARWVEEMDASERLAECCAHFREQGVVLVSIDISSDCWPLAAIPEGQVEEAVALAGRIGMGEILVLDESGDDGSAGDDPGDAPAAAGRDAVRLGLELPERAAYAEPVAVVTSSIDERSVWVDLSAWPPTVSPLQGAWTRAAARARDGRWLVLSGFPKKQRWIRIYPRTLGAKPLVEFPPVALEVAGKAVEFTAGGFVGDRALVLGGATARGNRGSVLVSSPVPHVQEGARLVPARGFDAGPGPAEHDAVIACDDGSDLVVWGGRIFELSGDAFGRALPFDLPPNHGGPKPTFVATRDGFFTVGGGQLLEVRRGEKRPIVHLADIEDVSRIAPGPEGTIVLATYRGADEWQGTYRPKTRKAEPFRRKFPAGADVDRAFHVAATDSLVTVTFEEGLLQRAR